MSGILFLAWWFFYKPIILDTNAKPAMISIDKALKKKVEN